MNAKRITASIVGALVAGVVLGSAVSGFAAAPATSVAGATTGVAAVCSSAGMRLGSAMRDGGGRLLDVVAKLTGTSTAAVQTERAAGNTFTQIAAEKNVSSAAVVAEALKVRESLLADKVTSGTITKAQADTALTNMKTKLAARVDTANSACDGTGAGAGSGRGAGARSGMGMGAGRGAGAGRGNGANYTTATQ